MREKDVLIVDDDDSVLEVLEMYCADLDIFRNIIKAKNGSEATSKLENQSFALILMDVNMPKKSGIDIIKEFKRYKLNSLSSLLVVSGEIDKNVIRSATSVGVKNFLVKPFDEDKFRARVMPILNALD
jgi:response regulator of citrate/malate metabolism